MFKTHAPKRRLNAGVTVLEIGAVLAVLSLMVILFGVRYSSIRPGVADYQAGARYLADQGEIARQGAGFDERTESQAPFDVFDAVRYRTRSSTAQGVVVQFNLGDASHTVHHRTRALTPAVIDKLGLYREAVK